MSVQAFIDITEEEQVKELRSYLKEIGANISEDLNSRGLEVDLMQIIDVSDILWKECSESDAEAAFNGIVSLIHIVPLDKAENLVIRLCDKLAKVTQGDKTASARLWVISNLFLGLDERAYLRYYVFKTLVKLASITDNMQVVIKDLDRLKSWFKQWNLPIEKVHSILRLLHETLLDCHKSEAAATVMVELLSTYTEDNASQARDDAHKCIVTSLEDPNLFLLDNLLTLKPVKFLEGELIHDLLTIFVSGKLSSYIHFYENNTDFVHSLGMSHESNLKKMRLLTFMQMAENKKEIYFDSIEEELKLNANEVEAFVIDVVRTKFVRAKIDQMLKKVIISSTMHRTFGKPQWQQLKDRLEAWRLNLHAVQESLQAVGEAEFEQISAAS